eukprot:m.128736 g.128736  ORF g.128736 m.128736 type:complete len:206 (+) comp23604_c0_seq2:171-788(+)
MLFTFIFAVLCTSLPFLRAASTNTTCGHVVNPLPTNNSINLDKYSGIWYKVYMSKFIFDVAQNNLTCIRVNMPAPVVVSNHSTYFLSEYSRKGSVTGPFHVENATIVHEHGGVFQFWQDITPFYKLPYLVLDLHETNNTYTMAVLYTCAAHIGAEGIPGIWVMSRTKTLPSDVSLNDIQQLLTRLGFDLDTLQLLPVEQSEKCGF